MTFPLDLVDVQEFASSKTPAPLTSLTTTPIALVPRARAFVWYLATPYTDPSAEVRERRAEVASRMTARLMTAGLNVFSPIAAHHPITQYMDSTRVPSHAQWMDICNGMLDRCDGLLVSTMDGWFTSKGVQMEIDRWQLTRGVENLLYVSPLREGAAWNPRFAWRSHQVEGL